MTRSLKFTFMAFVLLVSSQPGLGAIDAYPFPNDELRARYDALIDELRCPQCLNTNLAGSDAMIAQDLRREVHRMLIEGASDDEILDFMHERYGDFILYEPRLSLNTLLLWFGPVLFGLMALMIIVRMTRKQDSVEVLSADDEERVKQLLKESDSK